MGGKAGTAASVRVTQSDDIAAFIAAVDDVHRPAFLSLRKLIFEVAPAVVESRKWGTLAYDFDGSLFALSAPKRDINLYILTTGVIAAHADELAGIPQTACVLRFAAGVKPPLATLAKVLKAALAVKLDAP